MARWRLSTARRGFAAAGLLLLGLLGLAGCDTERYSEDLRFPVRTDPLVTELPKTDPSGLDRPGQLAQLPQLIEREKGTVFDPTQLSGELRQQFQAGLDGLFGTPAYPRVGEVDADLLARLKLDEATLAQGSQLYRLHCLHCHGLAGDGRGPTGPWVNPHPRDYRQGQFKFTSTSPTLARRKPHRDDLVRVLRQGIDGTSMPSFVLLPDEQLQALASAVLHLSVRGEAEFVVMRDVLARKDGSATDPDTDERTTIDNALKAHLRLIARAWAEAQEPGSLIRPEDYPYKTEEERAASARRGQRIFDDDQIGGCTKCHASYGRSSTFRYDTWGTIVRPIDLTGGTYRGGRRPLDLYYRIYGGILPAGMADFRELNSPRNKDTYAARYPDDKGGLAAANFHWDVINFLQALPYPELRERYGITID